MSDGFKKPRKRKPVTEGKTKLQKDSSRPEWMESKTPLQLRIPNKMLPQIDLIVAKQNIERAGQELKPISRHDWLMAAITEKIKREGR